jgi:hypothetical protein
VRRSKPIPVYDDEGCRDQILEERIIIIEKKVKDLEDLLEDICTELDMDEVER